MLCPICHAVPLTGRQTVCSGKCRIARSRERREAGRKDRLARAGLLLRIAAESIEEARSLLSPE